MYRRVMLHLLPLPSLLAALLLCAVPLAAQIILDIEDLQTPIGTRLTLESVVYEGPVGETGIELGPAGADRVFDFTDALTGAFRLEVEANVVALGEAPAPDAYPDADYAILYEMRDGDGNAQEMVAYVARDEAGDRVVGLVGAGEMPFIAQQAPEHMPMTYGRRWEDPNTAVDTELEDGVRMVGTLSQEGEVDGWGRVIVPAGNYPCLRIHQSSSGEVRYEGNPDLAAMGSVHTATEGWVWSTRYLGGVAMVAQVTTTLQGTTSTTTQVTRLLRAEGPASAVVTLGWGTLKSLHARGMRSPSAAETGR